MSGRLSGWRLALRLAARDALRHRGRSVLVLVMIALPVAAVGVADTVYGTAETSGLEAVERRLGTADARVDLGAGGNEVFQLPDPEDGLAYAGAGRRADRLTAAGVLEVLGGERASTSVREGTIRYETALGIGDAEVLELDLDDPLTDGLVELTDGRWPATPGEAVVSPELRERAPGEELVLADGRRLAIVGTARSARYTGYPRAFGLPGAFDLGTRAQESLLVSGGVVTWSQVLELNERGGAVTSRAVLADPPAEAELAPEVQWGVSTIDGAVVTVLVLVVVMVLLEVVLLAGPAFAVGARRQARTLALVAAAGGTPAQARRVVLASGVVLGLAAAALGTALGIGGAAMLMPAFQLASGTRFGPFDVDPLHLLGVAGFGVLSALLAAAVPAWLASRQDVVAVLAGRRGDARPSRRSPLLGLVLLGVGVAAAAYGASQGTSGGGEVPIAASAVICVLGMILLVPVVVATLARLAGRLPLPLRFAARDAARHRTRTVPAVAAVAATVAGVVALGIALTSDEAQNRETYRASLPLGAGSLTDYRASADYAVYTAAVRDVAPDLDVELLRGLTERRAEVRLSTTDGERVLSSYGGAFSSSVLVADEVPRAVLDLDAAERAAADRVLSEGGMLVLTGRDVADTTGRVLVRGYGREATRERVTAPAVFVTVEDDDAPVQGVVSTEVAARLGSEVEVTEVGLYLPGPVGAATAQDLREVVEGISATASVYVEEGYQTDDETAVVQLVLAALGAVLMLGGTLTATFLALSDARPDLATLAAVGATPRTRRGVAAAYALVVGLVGAVLGALVGAVPGVAITFPLTGSSGFGGADAPAYFLDVPWLLVVGVVVGLPLLTAALVGLATRSRLPLTARLD